MTKIGQLTTATIICCLLSACSNTRRLPAGESLYVGSKVSIKDDKASNREKKVLTTDLQGAVRPKPNSKLLGMRLKLSIYNLVGQPKKEKGLKHWIRTKFGEPPVLASSVDINYNSQVLRNILENKGFFYPNVVPSFDSNKKRATAKFEVYTGPQYKIRNVEFVTDSTQITYDIADQQPESLLKPGLPFNLSLIKAERVRIDQKLNEIGYYYFVPDDILIQTDSTVGDHQVDLFVKIKDNVPEDVRMAYRIKDVFIYPNYRIRDNINRTDKPDTNTTTRRRRRGVVRASRRYNDTLFYQRYYIVGNTRLYKPYVFTQAMQFEPDDPYNRTDHNLSLNRLINMGTFKFVKNEFEPVDTGKLNAYYYLTPNPKKSLQAEIGAYTKSDSRVGSQLNINWRNRNALRGAELLTIRGAVGFESQAGGGVNRPGTYQLLVEPRISFPRFIVPFVKVKSSSMFVPQTVIYTGYEAILRRPLYNLHSFKAGYGYTWKEDAKRSHELYPININYVITDTLDKDTTFFLNYGNLLFNGLIIGPTYNFTYNSRGNGPPHRQDFYFNGLIDMSGNVLGLVQKPANGDAQRTIFGQSYAQYIKLQTDFRYYLNYGANKNSIWANRMIIGFGYPHGNSNQLPNIKQFFSGGNSSLRGFPSRLVGPGRFHRTIDGIDVIETSGDIKLEFNTELRAQLFDFIHGAVFLDAGNVWTYHSNTIFGESGQFKFNRFWKELAVNTGVGIRFDFSILVLRFDFGVPIRKPWLYDNPKVTDAIRTAQSGIKRQDVIFNLAIGYPF